MTHDSGTPAKRRISDTAFFGVLVVIVLVIIGVGMYLVGPLKSPSKAPLSSAIGANQLLAPTPSTSGHAEAGALALVEKSFQLSSTGKEAAACALESPAYLRSDARRYPHGGCAAESRAVAAALAAKGLAVRLISTSVASFSGNKATILVTVGVGTQVATEHVYLGYRAGKWWMTGGDDSGGDVGF